MNTREAIFWSSYSAVPSPNLKEESFAQRSVPPGVGLFSASGSINAADAPKKKITRRQLTVAVLIYIGNFFAAMSFSLQAPFFPKEVSPYCFLPQGRQPTAG